jgi:deoxyribose-phosphate aldolase
MKMLSRAELARCLDLSLAQPDATRQEIESLCAEAAGAKCRAVCLAGSRVELGRARVEESGVQIVGLVGFPLGVMDGDAKRFETEVAVDQGAQEIEMVLNVGQLKDGDDKQVLRELRDVAEAADERPVCVAVETALLTPEETILACHLILDSGAVSVATGTGFWPARLVGTDDVKRLREVLGPKFGLKAVGGVGDETAALALLEAGATRIGLSTAATWWKAVPAGA